MPGKSPQGTLLGVILFLVYVSDIGIDHTIIDLPSVPSPPPSAISENEARLKFVGALSLAECISLDKLHHSETKRNSQPPSFQSVLQKRLDDISMT